jgi:hypothetical protein
VQKSSLAGSHQVHLPHDSASAGETALILRRWRHLAEKRIKDVPPSIPSGKNFWALTAAEKKGLADFFGAPETRKSGHRSRWSQGRSVIHNF